MPDFVQLPRPLPCIHCLRVGANTNPYQALFRTREQKTQTGSEAGFHLISQHRLDVFIRIIVIIVSSVLLLIPVFILFSLSPNTQADAQHQGNLQILTIFIFTIVFSGSCSIFTQAKRQEVFAATAAYCAVLVVFLGNSTNVTMVANGMTTRSGN